MAAVYSTDDYGNAESDSHWAQLGDTVTLRYVEEFEYYNPDTGEIYEGSIPENQPYLPVRSNTGMLTMRWRPWWMCPMLWVTATMAAISSS